MVKGECTLEKDKLDGYEKRTNLKLINYTGGKKVTKRHLIVPSARFLIEDLEKKGIDYRIRPHNQLKGFKIYYGDADLLIKEGQVYP